MVNGQKGTLKHRNLPKPLTPEQALKQETYFKLTQMELNQLYSEWGYYGSERTRNRLWGNRETYRIHGEPIPDEFLLDPEVEGGADRPNEYDEIDPMPSEGWEPGDGA